MTISVNLVETPVAVTVDASGGSVNVSAATVSGIVVGVGEFLPPSPHAATHQPGGADELQYVTRAKALYDIANDSDSLRLVDGVVEWPLAAVVDYQTAFRESISAASTTHADQHGVDGTDPIGAAALSQSQIHSTLGGADIEDDISYLSLNKANITHAASHGVTGDDPLSPSDIGAAEVYHTHNAADISDGLLSTARLGGGTASSSTFLRGDQLFATVSDTFIFTRTSAPASASGSNGSYTWSIPATAKAITIDCTGGGGGGGSGRRGAAGTVRGGGGGGGGGGRSVFSFPLSEMSDRALSIAVGAGGAGGAAVSANSTNGNAGASGGRSTVRITAGANDWLCYAWEGTGGGGGTTSGGGGGSPAFSNLYPAASGGDGGASSAGSQPGFSVNAASSGGGGGGISASDTAYAGGQSFQREITRNLAAASNAGAVGSAGGNGASVLPGGSGNGGGGGGASITAAAGAGGNGSDYGGGGGGGGASLNGFASGAGGNGGAGLVRITVWY